MHNMTIRPGRQSRHKGGRAATRAAEPPQGRQSRNRLAGPCPGPPSSFFSAVSAGHGRAEHEERREGVRAEEEREEGAQASTKNGVRE